MNTNLKNEGDNILYQEGLLKILEDIGEVKIVGSYDLDLLIKPDIDITIGVEKYDIDKYFDACKEIVKKLNPIRIKYLDQSVAQFEAFPFDTGYFLGINLKRNNINWSIDAWVFTNDIFKERVEYHNEIKNKLNKENRDVLLNIKESICDNPNYRSVDLYKAVLWEDVNTTEGYREWYKAMYAKEY